MNNRRILVGAALALSAGAAMFMPTGPLVRQVARRRLTTAVKPKRTRPFKGSKAAKRATKRGGNHGRQP